MKSKEINVPYELTWFDGVLKDSYLHDMQIVQGFASLNRRIILDELVKGMKWKILDTYECIHTGITVTSTAERTQQLNRKDALQKLNAILAAKENENKAKQINDAWREHTMIIRGNPVRVYRGMAFIYTLRK